jgi:hypothetical protein
MDFAFDARTEQRPAGLVDFVVSQVHPAEPVFAEQLTVEWILDKAIQVHGAAGLSQDFPLAAAFAGIRTLRLADGPDEVHKNALARTELKQQRARREGTR